VIARYADMFSAMGTEPRLRIIQLLITADPEVWLANCYFASRRACNIVTFCRRVSAA
jgi:hypothetical protein